METRPQKTYSVIEAANLSGYSRPMVSRLCNRGIIGVRHLIPEINQTVYRISKKEIALLKRCKKQGFRKSWKKP